MQGYTPSEIVGFLEGPQTAGCLARTIEAFWPTIKAALIEYEKVHPNRVEPIGSPD